MNEVYSYPIQYIITYIHVLRMFGKYVFLHFLYLYKNIFCLFDKILHKIVSPL